MKRVLTVSAFLMLCSVLKAQAIGVALPGSPAASTTIGWMAKTVVTSVTCPQTTLEQGTSMTCTAVLNQALPTDKTATLVSSDPTKITVPATILVTKGSTSFTFVATAI